MIRKYFKLSEKQAEQFDALEALYRDWNAKINVITRKDIDNLYLHHVLHSLAIAKVLDTEIPMKVLDFGTGGGFPGIPLAMFYPSSHFVLLDSTNKKVNYFFGVIFLSFLRLILMSSVRPIKYLFLFRHKRAFSSSRLLTAGGLSHFLLLAIRPKSVP